MKNNKGQSLYYFLILTVVLVLSWAMMLNIAKLVRDRMIMQNEADNIALSISVHKARAMNFAAACNYLIGSLLALGTKPEFVQFPTYTTNAVAAFPFGDYRKNTKNKALSDDVAILKKAIESLQKAQEAALIAHLAYQNALLADHALNSEYKLVIYPTALATKSNAEKYFGLKRNSKGITYLKTVNTDQRPLPHIVYNPFPLGDILEEINGGLLKLLENVGMDPDSIIMKAFGLSSSALKQQVYEKAEYSWYVADKNFGQQKVQVALVKMSDEKNKPLFAKWLDIDYPSMAVFSASGIYNADGPMFPTEESDLIGMSDMEGLLYAALAAQMGIFIANLASEDPTPYKILTIALSAYLLARTALRAINVKNDPKTSPINAYNDAKFGGWGAHLIPYKSSTESNAETPQNPSFA
ncbi:MAG: hypothetical protein LBB93_06390 [Elusimicrobiota bacterium]|jgi:hypothetical protein|nr:hypothetical protein [Elusimicrobiota bacterium]